jgi:hypothetical protein
MIYIIYIIHNNKKYFTDFFTLLNLKDDSGCKEKCKENLCNVLIYSIYVCKKYYIYSFAYLPCTFHCLLFTVHCSLFTVH